MNSSVTAADCPHNFQRVTAVRKLYRLWVRAAIVLPGEPKQRSFGRDENDAREPEDEHEQLVDDSAVFEMSFGNQWL